MSRSQVFGWLALLTSLFGFGAHAQEADTAAYAASRALSGRLTSVSAPRSVYIVLDLSRGLGSELSYASTAGWLLFGLNESQSMQAGLGLRANFLWAGSGKYEPQPPSAGDTLQVPAPRVLALNVAFHLRVRLAGAVRLGANFDFAGVGFGPARTAKASSAARQAVFGRPELFNLARDESDSRGSLTSELYAAADLPQQFAVRLGYSRATTAYTTHSLTSDAVRYRRRDNMLVLGLSYTLP